MIKKILMVIMVCCFMPSLALAAPWTLTTTVKSVGGAIQVGSATPQTAVNIPVYTTYPTDAPVTVTVLPAPGFMCNRVIYNGTVISNPTQTSFTVKGPTAQNVYAYFLPAQTLSITASVAGNAGGAVDPAHVNNLLFNQGFTAPLIITYTPGSSSHALTGITGVPTGAVQSPAVPGAGQPVTVTFPVGFTPTSNINLVGTFVALFPSAKIVSTVPALINKTVTLDGTGSISGGGISSYSWAQTSGPEVVLSNTAAVAASFIPSVAGTYSFSLTLQPGGSVAIATVEVYDSLPAFVRVQCYNCHYAVGAGVAANVFGNWSSSIHKTKSVFCSQCHVGADTGSHPSPLIGGSVSTTTFSYITSVGSGNFCVTCHSPVIVTDFAASIHSIRAGSASCSYCHTHGLHNTIAVCTDCHNTNNTYGLPWPPVGREFHSNFAGTNNICKVCHTTHNPKVINVKTSCP